VLSEAGEGYDYPTNLQKDIYVLFFRNNINAYSHTRMIIHPNKHVYGHHSYEHI
jgi:hypothetical protein